MKTLITIIQRLLYKLGLFGKLLPKGKILERLSGKEREVLYKEAPQISNPEVLIIKHKFPTCSVEEIEDLLKKMPADKVILYLSLKYSE